MHELDLGQLGLPAWQAFLWYALLALPVAGVCSDGVPASGVARAAGRASPAERLECAGRCTAIKCCSQGRVDAGAGRLGRGGHRLVQQVQRAGAVVVGDAGLMIPFDNFVISPDNLAVVMNFLSEYICFNFCTICDQRIFGSIQK